MDEYGFGCRRGRATFRSSGAPVRRCHFLTNQPTGTWCDMPVCDCSSPNAVYTLHSTGEAGRLNRLASKNPSDTPQTQVPKVTKGPCKMTGHRRSLHCTNRSSAAARRAVLVVVDGRDGSYREVAVSAAPLATGGVWARWGPTCGPRADRVGL